MFKVADPSLIDTAVLLLQWPFSYALNDNNVDKFLAPHYANNPGLSKAVSALIGAQTSLLPLPSNESLWREATNLSEALTSDHPVRTQWSASDASVLSQFTRVINVPLYESVSIALHRKRPEASRVCDRNDLKMLTQCVWLSSLIALCVLGVARSVLDGANVRFEVADTAARLALRRAWFGVAFDQYTRIGDEAELEAALKSRSLRLDEVIHLFTKQWRLGLPTGDDGKPEGTVFGLLDRVLLPAVKLLAACVQLSERNHLLTRDHAQQMGCIHEFDLIEQHMWSLPISERAFQPRQAGLILGPLQLVPALMSVSERIARDKLGNNWHASLGPEMARYLASRMEDTPGVRIIEVELLQHMTSSNTPLDVDLFIVDDRVNRVYAIQCKHFESSFRVDLLDWLVRFRRPRNDERKGLDKALQQLGDLQQLCRDDARIQRALVEEVGLTRAQIETIRPIVIHNLGNLDFWQIDQGTCIYDLHTFCNAMKGREGALMSISPSGVAYRGMLRSEAIADMSDPDSVLSAYLNDSNALSRDLAEFDAMARVRRETNVGDLTIVADGLGL